MGIDASGSPEGAVLWVMGGNELKEQHGGARGHSGAGKAGFRSQENFQELELRIHQMVKADIAKMMPIIFGNAAKTVSDVKHLICQTDNPNYFRIKSSCSGPRVECFVQTGRCCQPRR